MAFPTTDMPGYATLRDRANDALDRCQEERWVDFKESQPWDVLKWRITKTSLAMANLRDGGMIIVGVSERGDKWDLSGILSAHLATYDADNIFDHVAKYASPEISIDLVTHKYRGGEEFLVIQVDEFRETPVVCKRQHGEHKLRAGALYVRPSGKPRSEEVKNAHQMHDLLELAAEDRARRMLEVSYRIGVGPGETASDYFAAEIKGIRDDLPVRVIEHPHWRIEIRPEEYSSELMPSRSKCFEACEKAMVRLRGWPYPCVNPDSTHRAQGSDWVASWADFMGEVEYWRLYQSSHFIHFRALNEATDPEWQKKLEKDAKHHLGHVEGIEWSEIPGYVSVTQLLYTVTEVFEFAARMCQAGVYRGAVFIKLQLLGIKGRALMVDWNRAWSEYRHATEDSLEKTWRIASDALVANAAEHALQATTWVLEGFGWMNPPMEVLKSDQEKFLRRVA